MSRFIRYPVVSRPKFYYPELEPLAIDSSDMEPDPIPAGPVPVSNPSSPTSSGFGTGYPVFLLTRKVHSATKKKSRVEGAFSSHEKI